MHTIPDYELSLNFLSDLRMIVSHQPIVDKRPAARYVAWSLDIRPSPVCLAFVEGTKLSVTSQIGAKLALDAMITECSALRGTINGPEIVQTGFREANRQLYQYGAKMLSGGRIAAHALFAAFDGKRLTIGRTAPYESYLLREGKLSQFFGTVIEPSSSGGSSTMERFLGTGKQVLVDIATVQIEKGDRVLLSSLPRQESLEPEILSALNECGDLDEVTFRLIQQGAHDSLTVAEGGQLSLEQNLFFAAFDFS